MTEIGGGFQQTIEFLLHHFIFLFWNLEVKEESLFVITYSQVRRENIGHKSSQPVSDRTLE